LTAYADNAHPHTAAASYKFMAENGITKAPQLPYSPDLRPSDFYRFGDMKQYLRGPSFKTPDELLLVIEAVL
jgi:hypothetical protein